MKKSFLALMGVGLLLSSSGCKDILEEDPRSVLVPSFLGTPQGIEAGLTGVYSGMRNIYGNEQGMFMAVTGTDEYMRGIATQDGLDEYNRGGGFGPASGVFTNQWNIIYRYINDANGVLKYSASVQGMAPARLQQIVAETKLLRAQYYFLLVRYWGDVPLMLSFVETPTKAISRAPIADVYNAIVQDLNDALAGLPDQTAGFAGVPNTGRVTRATALHLLAKVHLTRATSSARQADDYAKAKQYSEDLITNRARYARDLEADPAQVFAEGNENGKEILFNVQYNADATFSQTDPFNATGANVSTFLFRSRYDLVGNMVRDIPNGRPFSRFVPTPYLFSTYVLPGESGPTLRTTDTRYNKWFTTLWRVNSPGNNGGNAAAVRGDTALWYPGYQLSAARLARIAGRTPAPYRVIQPSQYTTEYYPVLNKYDDTRRGGVNNPSTRPFIVYRLAETYLIAAEANMYLGNLPQAVAHINTVRERAAAPGRQAQMRITASQLNIDFILDERTRELAGEHTRWLDLVRTGKLVERVQDVTKVPRVQTVPGGTYGSAAGANIQACYILRPIPQQEIDRTSGLIQQQNGCY
ncbi:RagB/SusD family nutrient uptake outer membrane protein [Hymenobacter koreensis]